MTHWRSCTCKQSTQVFNARLLSRALPLESAVRQGSQHFVMNECLPGFSNVVADYTGLLSVASVAAAQVAALITPLATETVTPEATPATAVVQTGKVSGLLL